MFQNFNYGTRPTRISKLAYRGHAEKPLKMLLQELRGRTAYRSQFPRTEVRGMDEHIERMRMCRIIPSINIERLKFNAQNRKGNTGRKDRRRLAILERDNFRCVSCGTDEGLTIAHIKPIHRSGNHRSGAGSFKMNECKTQCVKCHIKEEFNESVGNYVSSCTKAHNMLTQQ